MSFQFRVYTLFFASGVAGLIYQVVWLRMLSRIMGVTIYATSTVLAAFMGGLALGSFVLGKYVDRQPKPLRIYGVLELLIGISAILVPLALAASMPLYAWAYGATGEAAGVFRVIYTLLVLLVPTTMMGGTLPVLTSCLVRSEGLFGKNFSLLYGLNTIGAVVGVLLCGFVTIGLFGEWISIFIGVALNLGVAVVALQLSAKLREGEADAVVTAAPEMEEAAATTISPYGDGIRRLVLVAFALSGFTALAYEIIWTRQLIIFLRTSIYAFSGMLAVFLTGIALGSLVMNKAVDRLKSPLLVFGGLELLVGFLSLFNLYLFSPLDSNVARAVFGLSAAGWATLSIVLPLTLVFGMIFPTAAVCYAKSANKAGSAVGGLYSANTVGSILGALFAGFLLVPSLGSTNTVLVLAVINGLLGVTLIAMEPARGWVWKGVSYAVSVPVILLLAIGVGTTRFLATIERRIVNRIGTTWIPSRYAELPDSHAIYFHGEGIEGTVTAFEVNRFKQLWINGTGMTFLNVETKLMAYMPLMMVEQPKEFLAIAFGMGTTVRSASLYEKSGLGEGLNISAVDLVPETFENYGHYHPDGEAILAQDNVEPIVNDGRNHLLVTDKRYDVITVDPAPPIWSAGTVNLYTQQFFELARSRLTPDGVFCSWFPSGTQDEVASLVRTFHSVYPEAKIWSGPHDTGYYLIGPNGAVDWNAYEERVAKTFAHPMIARDLTEYEDFGATPEEMHAMLMWETSDIQELAEDGVLITDNFPYTEFPLWRYLMGNRGQWHPRSSWLIGNEPSRDLITSD